MSDGVRADILGLTAEIVSAHIGRTRVAPEDLPSLIQSVYRSLATAGIVEPRPAGQNPAVPIKKSVFPDYIISLEDGTKLKTLKRHLKTRYNLTPEEYRAKWGLAADYPMVAPNYAAMRSAFAKDLGLGRHRQRVEPEVKVIPARRARR